MNTYQGSILGIKDDINAHKLSLAHEGKSSSIDALIKAAEKGRSILVRAVYDDACIIMHSCVIDSGETRMDWYSVPKHRGFGYVADAFKNFWIKAFSVNPIMRHIITLENKVR